MNAATLRLLLISTVTLMFLFVIGNFISNHLKDANSYSLNTSNQPTIGNLKSKTKAVVFLDPLSPSCKEYYTTLFPKLKKIYVDKGMIQYTVIIVSYVDGSMKLAEALLCTYYQDEKTQTHDLFFNFLDYLYKNQEEAKEDSENIDHILELAKKADPSIDLDKIKKCVENDVYHTKIMQNNAEGIRVTSNHLHDPVLFINDSRVDIHEPEKIFKLIDEGSK